MISDMKRLLLLLPLAAILLLSFPVPLSASAAEKNSYQEPLYAVADGTDVWFYASESESSRLFLLPATYYVHILSEGEEYYRVDYLQDETPYRRITGYCRKDSVIPVDYIPVRPFLKREITLSYTLGKEGSFGGGSFSTVEKSFVYYGHRYEGAQLYFYVLSGETFDYIPAERELEYERNTDYLDYLAALEEAEDEEQSGLSAAAIAVIAVACVAAVGIAVLVVRGKRQPSFEERAEL